MIIYNILYYFDDNVTDFKFDATSMTQEDNAYKSSIYTYRNRDFEDHSLALGVAWEVCPLK